MRIQSYRDAADLRAMQALAQRIWSPASRWHIGDLAWERNQHTGREPEWPTQLWLDEGEVVAWGWFELPNRLSLQVDPARPELAGEVLGWARATTEVTVLETEEHLITALAEHGFRRDNRTPFSRHLTRSLADLPDPVLPAGFVARSIQDADLPRRVMIHRAAWRPSRVTQESYRNVMSAWPYRLDLDWVIEAPNGEFAANCLIWLDEHNRVAELEPVGTDPALRRMGLAHAVCLAAMHAAREAGAEQAIVYPVDGYPATDLYLGLGFQPYARTVTYVRR